MTGRRAAWIAVIVIVLAAVGAGLVVLWESWDDVDTGAGFTEFQRATSPDGEWMVVLEEARAFGFGPRRIRVLTGPANGDVRIRGSVGVGTEGAYLVGCGLRWAESSVTVRCVDDTGGEHEITVGPD
ncbi:MAG: hypothetical protein R3290_09540 [Acidimicrobiia bacterium]|nr:hypothetical protein [Acidimicrobiia bacterium]